MKKYIRYTILIFSISMFGLGVLFSNTDVILWGICGVIINNIIYCIEDFNKRIIFFTFNITFFTFLVGRLVVKTFSNYEDKYDIYNMNKYGLDFYDMSIINHIFISIFISLLFVFIGYYTFSKLNCNKNKKVSDLESLDKNYIYSIAFVSKLVFYVTYIFNTLVLLDKVRFTSNVGYTELYSSYYSTLPHFIIKLGEMCTIALFIYLGTLPKKKDTIIPVSLYILSGIISLVIGQRNNFVLNIMIVLVYFCLRNITDEGKMWFGKKEIIATVCILPVLIVLLNAVSYTRSDEGLNQTSVINTINEFIYKQGASVNLIGYAETLKDYLPDGRNYTFGRLIDFINENAITQLLFDAPVYKSQSVESALYGNSFADSISYLISPHRYVRGWGYGSSYVAELYKDFGNIGVMVGNFIIGIILAYMSVLFKKGPVVAGLSLYMIRLLLYSPRDTTTSFFVTSFSLINILTIVIILIGSKIITKKIA